MAVERAIYRAVAYTTELVLAVCCALFGVTLLAVPDVFSAPLYGPMQLLASAQVWGTLLLVLGCGRIALLLFTRAEFYAWRRRASVVTLVVVWLPVWISLWWLAMAQITVQGTGSFLPGMILAPVVASYELVCWMVLTALNARGLSKD